MSAKLATAIERPVAGGEGSAPRTKRKRSLLPCTDSSRLRPQRPSPTIAASITRLFGLDASLPDVAGPFVDFLPEIGGKLVGVHGRWVDAERGKAQLEIRLRHSGEHRVVNPADRRPRCAGGRDQAVPENDFVARDLPGDRRNVRREAGAPRPCDPGAL